MAKFEVKLPKMGESVAEATVINWLKTVGETIEMDEAIVEIATDKVDSEIPSEVNGTLVEILVQKDAVVKVGETIAIIETSDAVVSSLETNSISNEKIEEDLVNQLQQPLVKENSVIEKVSKSGKFFSPLVRTIAQTEGISMEELDTIIGTGLDNRVTKNDILSYIETGKKSSVIQPAELPKTIFKNTEESTTKPAVSVTSSAEDEIIEMTRMGKLIAQHMVASVQTSAHVQSFIEVDVTNIVKWREKNKDKFFAREGEKITYTPIFIQTVVQVIKEFPMINISVDGDKIIKRKAINLGMAAALPDGNLIVPVIKNADRFNLVGMTKVVNDLAERARKGQLKPDEIQGGTYTVTNVGSFGSVFGTPIINQPQVAILALGAVRKVPAVIETTEGDFIGIRHKMFISHSYDHRVVNGAMGGLFIKRVKELMESWDVNSSF